mgnify:FL=1
MTTMTFLTNLLPTEPVTFHILESQETTDFGEQIKTYRDLHIPNCLVAPQIVTELGTGEQLLQRTLLSIHVPGSYKDDLNNAMVSARGKEYRVVTSKEPYTKSPLVWDREVLCEVVD